MDSASAIGSITPALLTEALTHPSTEDSVNNERLEFLGDAVLEMIVSEWLYANARTFPEGRMSQVRAAVVREESLAAAARTLNLGALLRLGKGEERNGGRDRTSVLANCMEAIIAALYLSRGLAETRTFVLLLLNEQLEKACADDFIIDYRTEYRVRMHARGIDDIEYILIKEAGPSHDKTFWVQVRVAGKTRAEGRGKTKKQAEQEAARRALSIDFAV